MGQSIILWAAGALAGALLVYLAAPNQQVFARKGTARKPLALLGLLTLGSTTAALVAPLSGIAAIFTVVVVTMLAWSLLPLIAAWLRRGQGDRS